MAAREDLAEGTAHEFERLQGVENQRYDEPN